MSQQRILIVLEDGKFIGANITTDTGSPAPLDLSALGKLLPELNAAAVQTLDSIEAEHAAALAAEKSARGVIVQTAEDTIAAKDAEMAKLTADHVGELTQITAARDAARAAYEEKSAYQAAMEQRVSAVIQSGDPAQYEALAKDFLTPAQEKERAEKLATIAKLQAELGIK